MRLHFESCEKVKQWRIQMLVHLLLLEETSKKQQWSKLWNPIAIVDKAASPLGVRRFYTQFSFCSTYHKQSVRNIRTREKHLRYACVIQLFFLIRHLHLIGVWFAEGQRINTINCPDVDKWLDCVFKFYWSIQAWY